MKAFHTSLLALLLLAVALPSCKTSSAATKYVPVKDYSKYLQGRWVCDSMYKDNKSIDYKKVSGTILMKFDKDKFTMSMAGEERTFTFGMKDEIIMFTDVKNYPNITVKSLEKGKKFVGQQYYPNDNFTITWVMVPFKE